MDTHTAVAYKVYRDYVSETGDNTPAVIAATASAYKFAEKVAQALGMGDGKVKTMLGITDSPSGFDYVRALEKYTGVHIPYGLVDLDKRPVLHSTVCDKDKMADAVKDVLR